MTQATANKTTISALSQLIEREIKTNRFGGRPASLYEPLRYIMRLGGKRLRPMLTLLSYSLYRSDPERVLPIAAAVEAFHNFTLLHDDIMDRAPLRRGKPTVHEKWNTNTAILSGDVMLVKVYEMLMTAEDSVLREVLASFSACAAQVCEGQQWDMEFEAKHSVSEGRYLEMIQLKTASLLSFSLRLGATLAHAPEADKQALAEFGLMLGMGFQLKDDLLDVYADRRKFGKQVGGDIIANKKTFLLIRALQKARGENKRELKSWLGRKKFSKPKKVAAVTSIYNNLGIQQEAEKKIAAYFDLAFTALGRCAASPDRLHPLRAFASSLIKRQA